MVQSFKRLTPAEATAIRARRVDVVTVKAGDTVQSLAGHELHGLAPADLVKATGHTSSQITRDLSNLKSREWAEQIPQTGRWRLAPGIVRIGVKFAVAADQAQQRLTEMQRRYTADAL